MSRRLAPGPGAGGRRGPQRTCVGCRAVREQAALVRITAEESGGLRMGARAARGRGAYLCPSLACLAQALQRRALPRALRRDLPGLDPEALRRGLAAEMHRRGIVPGPTDSVGESPGKERTGGKSALRAARR